MALFEVFYNERGIEGSSAFLRKTVLKILNRYRLQGEKYLDIGCGDGTFTNEISELIRSKEVYGVDISQQAISLAQLKGVMAIKCDINHEKLPFSNNYFDLVTAIEIIEHTFNADNLLSEAYRVTKRGGYFLVTSPNLASWLSILSLVLGYLPPNYEVSFQLRIGKPLGEKIHIPLAEKPVGHIKPYVARALKEHVEAYGFKTISLVGVRLIEGSGILKFIGFFDHLFSKINRYASGIILLSKKV